jgi:hypothetical protein
MLAGPVVAAAFVLVAHGGIDTAVPPAARELTVCLTAPPDREVFEARALATRMFGDIGVLLTWARQPGACPFTGVRMNFWMRTPTALSPGAFGRSFPAEGTRIDVFYDRVRAAAPGARLPSVLGHVLAHELAHLAQAVGRHSPEGVMKARWKARDLAGMAWQPLSFTTDDVALIHMGLATRTVRLQARKVDGTQN